MATATRITDRITDMPGNVPVHVRKPTAAQQSAKDASLQDAFDAVGRSQAVVEFDMNGMVQMANPNFLFWTGYRLDEIVSKHHSIFVDPQEAQSHDYRAMWAALNRGETQTSIFRRFGKQGQEFWLQGCYMPILDTKGMPYKVMKIALDVTEAMRRNTSYRGQVEAVSRTQAVIEFHLDGTIVTANDNFLKTVGYTLAEIKDHHHSMFVDKDMRNSAAYRQFWAALARGEYQSGEYKRVGKGDREVWIYGSYNPIFDANGKPDRVVKFASDITATVHARNEHQAHQEAERQRGMELEAKVRDMLSVVQMARDGDLTGVIEIDGNDAIGQMGTALRDSSPIFVSACTPLRVQQVR